MTAVMDEKEVYLASFTRLEKDLAATGPDWLNPIRQAAIERFAALGFPTLDDEEWRFTPLAPLVQQPFALSPAAPPEIVPAGPLPPGVIACSLAQALARYPKLVQPHLARLADVEEHAFTALNTAFLQDGAFIY